MTTKSSKSDLKTITAKAKHLDSMKEDEFYDEDSGKWISCAQTDHYNLLDKQFKKMVSDSASSRGVSYDEVVSAIYDTKEAERLHSLVS